MDFHNTALGTAYCVQQISSTELSLTKLELPEGVRAVDAAAGWEHIVCLGGVLSSDTILLLEWLLTYELIPLGDGKLHGLGSAGYSQLGPKTTIAMNLPEELKQAGVKKVFAGSCSSLFISCN